ADDVLAVAIGQPEIEKDYIGRVGSHTFDGLRHRAGADDLEIVRFERRPQKPDDRRLIIDQEHAPIVAHVGGTSHGKTRMKRAPRPFATGLSTRIDPPCASMIPLAIASPSPVLSPPSAGPPAALANLSKICDCTSAATPGPSSVTRSTMSP